jgi:hypothetical protein
MFASLVGYTMALGRRVNDLRLVVDTATAARMDADRRLAVANKQEDDRLNVLESFVFGAKAAEKPQPVTAPDWLLNTAKQNRERLSALERWRQMIDEKLK